MKPWNNQIDNRNYLSPIGFKFSIVKIPKVDFFSNSVSIPGINLGFALQPTYLKDIPIPGDKLTYADLTLSFFVDEDLENYIEVHNWLRGLGFPESIQEFTDLKKKDPYNDNPDARTPTNEYSDASLFIYNSNYNEVARIDFRDIFPTGLSTVQFDAKAADVNYVTAEVTFKYSIYNIVVL